MPPCVPERPVSFTSRTNRNLRVDIDINRFNYALYCEFSTVEQAVEATAKMYALHQISSGASPFSEHCAVVPILLQSQIIFRNIVKITFRAVFAVDDKIAKICTQRDEEGRAFRSTFAEFNLIQIQNAFSVLKVGVDAEIPLFRKLYPIFRGTFLMWELYGGIPLVLKLVLGCKTPGDSLDRFKAIARKKGLPWHDGLGRQGEECVGGVPVSAAKLVISTINVLTAKTRLAERMTISQTADLAERWAEAEARCGIRLDFWRVDNEEAEQAILARKTVEDDPEEAWPALPSKRQKFSHLKNVNFPRREEEVARGAGDNKWTKPQKDEVLRSIYALAVDRPAVSVASPFLTCASIAPQNFYKSDTTQKIVPVHACASIW